MRRGGGGHAPSASPRQLAQELWGPATTESSARAGPGRSAASPAPSPDAPAAQTPRRPEPAGRRRRTDVADRHAPRVEPDHDLVDGVQAALALADQPGSNEPALSRGTSSSTVPGLGVQPLGHAAVAGRYRPRRARAAHTPGARSAPRPARAPGPPWSSPAAALSHRAGPRPPGEPEPPAPRPASHPPPADPHRRPRRAPADGVPPGQSRSHHSSRVLSEPHPCDPASRPRDLTQTI
jgi:hypothetical protein